MLTVLISCSKITCKLLFSDYHTQTLSSSSDSGYGSGSLTSLPLLSCVYSFAFISSTIASVFRTICVSPRFLTADLGSRLVRWCSPFHQPFASSLPSLQPL